MPALFILTGAGISADSGIPTFRGLDGLWEGHDLEDVATPEGWSRDPALVWRFYQQRRAALGAVQPNAAHHALLKLERALAAAGQRFTLVTQNVDDLHQRAGSQPIAMHGELRSLLCESCGARERDLEHLDPATFKACSSCAYPRLRPDVVWFGEMPRAIRRIENALAGCTHFLACGTSGNVYPAAGYLAYARAGGAHTWINSMEAPDNADPRDELLLGRASAVIPALVERLIAEWGLEPCAD